MHGSLWRPAAAWRGARAVRALRGILGGPQRGVKSGRLAARSGIVILHHRSRSPPTTPMPPSDSPILELVDLRKSFGATEAVAGVSQAFAPGEYVCVLGPSGCGKTTLLRLIAGFEAPDSGDVRLAGASVVGLAPERRDVNVVFQSYALFPHLSVRENVAFGPRMKRLPRAEVEERTSAALRLVRMEELGERRPRQLSGGQQQRVALARALVNRPRVLLLDEPLSALDRSLRIAMQEELRAVQRRTGVTFLHITHDQHEALTLADRVIVMRAGRFEQVGTSAEVYDRPRTRFVADFVGSSNLLEGTLATDGTVSTPEGIRATVAASRVPPGRVLVSLRPEALRVVPGTDGGGDPGASWVPGIVTRAAAAGPVLECRVDVGGRELVAHLPPRDESGALDEGQRVVVVIPAEAIVLLPWEEAPQ
ncbi:MAG: ABC transporter ATP-binding protein [Gemmatimonadetes bacterium]|nr:ABC transporter ATP-binding protein [Gemmatimonadota bacterium]